MSYQQEIKREQREHLISPDMTTKESKARSGWILECIYQQEIKREQREHLISPEDLYYFMRRQAARKGRSKMEYKFTTDNFDEEVLQSPLPVFVDFYADWCNPCKMMAPVVEKLAEEFDGRIKVGKCNIDENMQIAQRYRVASIPTFMIFKEGKPCAVQMGVQPASELKKMIEQV